MDTLRLDLKHAFRGLLRAPGFALIVILTLALGIGANTAMFSLMSQVLWKPLPFPDPSRLVAVEAAEPTLPWNSSEFSVPNITDVRTQTSSFSGMALLSGGAFNLGGDGPPEMVDASRISASFFDVLGVQPALGRGFTPEETQGGGPHAVILSHELWTSRYASDPGILGREIRLDGRGYQVVGVLPPHFQFLYHSGPTKLFVPLVFTKDETGGRGSSFVEAFARLKPGVTVQAADQDVVRVMAGLEKAYPGTNRGMTAGVRPLQDSLTDSRRAQLLLLLGVAGLVLLIACVNVTSLQLARGLARQQELAVRNSLGAPRSSLVRALMAESLLLAAAGAIAALFVAFWVAKGFVLIADLPEGIRLLPDAATFLFTGAVALITSLLSGLLPAWQASRGDLSPFLREGVRGGASRATHRLRSALVVAEIAMAAALLVGAGLTLRTLRKLQDAPLGFQPEGLIIGDIRLPDDAYSPQRAALFEQNLVRGLESAPGVASAAITDTLPMGGNLSLSGFEVEGEPDLPANRTREAYIHHVTPGFFKTMEIRMLAGRDFLWNDPGTCIINDTLARAHFPGQDALGKRINLDGDWHQIIGVVQRTDQASPGESPKPQIYLDSPGGIQVVVRAQGNPEALRATLAAAPARLDPDLPMYRISTATTLIHDWLRDTRAQGVMFAAFAAVALLLAAVGIYGLMSFIAQQRTREIGIRMALGATLRDVVQLILAQGARLVLAGLSAGLLGAAALTRLLESQFGPLSASDLPTYFMVAALLGLAALAACLLPALRAAKVDPMIALRSE